MQNILSLVDWIDERVENCFPWSPPPANLNGVYGSRHGHISNQYLNYPHFLVLYWGVCYVRSCQTVLLTKILQMKILQRMLNLLYRLKWPSGVSVFKYMFLYKKNRALKVIKISVILIWYISTNVSLLYDNQHDQIQKFFQGNPEVRGVFRFAGGGGTKEYL